MISTICRDCVFAEWLGNTQSGCQFDRIQKFIDRGTDVAVDRDKDRVYYRIVGRICNTCRHESTLENIPARKWKEAVRQEVTVQVAMVVYVDNPDDLSEMIQSLKSMYNQTVKPVEIVVIYNFNGQDASADFPAWFITNANDIPWRIVSVRITNMSYGYAMDEMAKSKDIKAVYFTICRAGYEYPIDYIETIDRAINDNLDRFIALLPMEDDNGLFVQKGLYNILKGNEYGRVHGVDSSHVCEDILEKILYVADQESTGHMIKRFEDLR